MGKLGFVVLLSAAMLARAQDQGHLQDHHAGQASTSDDAAIKITINPEARISVALGTRLPPPVACLHSMELPVLIVNRGYVTTPLDATLVAPLNEGVALEFSSAPLRGIPDERRVLRVSLAKRQPLFVTISFRIKNNFGDAGGNDRIHLLLRCI